MYPAASVGFEPTTGHAAAQCSYKSFFWIRCDKMRESEFFIEPDAIKLVAITSIVTNLLLKRT